MSTKAKLVAGLKGIRDDLLLATKQPGMTEPTILAAGFVIGWLDTEAIPRFQALPSESEAFLQSESDQYLASVREEPT